MSPEDQLQCAFQNGVSWGRFKERLESTEDLEWLRKRVLDLVDYLDLVADVPEAKMPGDVGVVHSVLIQSVRDRLDEQE